MCSIALFNIYMHCYKDLINLFNQCFAKTYNTRLIRGDDEPIYLPADASCSYHAIHFAHGFYSSALHECAHWFIAGETRRQCVDYGYWYIPDGRTIAEQHLFQQVEVKPQAIEWLLSEAAGYRFQFSIDNLTGESIDTEPFKQSVALQKHKYEIDGLPHRAGIFYEALVEFYGSSKITLVNKSQTHRASV